MKASIRKLALSTLVLVALLALSLFAHAETDQVPDGPIGLTCGGMINPNEVEPNTRKRLDVTFLINSDKTSIDLISKADDKLSDFQKSDDVYTFETLFNREIGEDFNALRLQWSIHRRTLQATVRQLVIDLIPGIPVFDHRNDKRPWVVWKTYTFPCRVVKVDAPI
jgi:hypothetical protein